jgi:[histone H3]-dimethyl-L-lysine9 demethylase
MLDMNAESHRRTSISQLLNPLANVAEQSSFAVPQNSSLSGAVGPTQLPEDQQPAQAPYNQEATFNLRAASWDHVQDDNNPNKRKPENGTAPSRVYHPSPMNPTEGFGDHGPRAARRVDEAGNYVDTAMWSPSHEIASMPYGTTAIAPMYSDERTGMCFDYLFVSEICSPSVLQP